MRDHIESPCGLRYVFEQLELQAGYTRRWMLDMPMMRTGEEIAQSYEVLRQFVRFVEEVDTPYINTLALSCSNILMKCRTHGTHTGKEFLHHTFYLTA